MSSFELYRDELLDLIVKAVNLKNLDRSSVDAETQIMTEGLALDSIDVLELVIALEKKYHFKIKNDQSARLMFKNLGSLADFVDQNKKTSVEATL